MQRSNNLIKYEFVTLLIKIIIIAKRFAEPTEQQLTIKQLSTTKLTT